MKARTVAPVVALIYLGVLAGVQSSDPNINSTALLRAAKALDMGHVAALAAAISTLAVAATVITTGMMADRLGRKKVITAAFVVTIVGDLLVMAAPGTSMFLVGRVLAGIGLGAVFGAAFAYVRHFATGKGGLPVALGTFGAAGGLAAVLLSFMGGMLAGIDWRLAYVLIPAASAICLVIGLIILPPDEHGKRTGGSWDATGQVLLALGIVGVLFGIAHASAGFSSPLTWAPLAGGAVLLVVFGFWEAHHPSTAFFPMSLLKQPIFIAAILVGLVYNLGYGAALLSFTNLFQYKLGLTGTSVALAQLPFLLAGVAAALTAGKLRGSGKLSRRGAVLFGTIIVAVGFASFAVAGWMSADSYLAYLPGVLLVGIGAIVASLPYGNMILQEADPKHYGPVSSSRTTIGQFWYSVGLAGSTVLIDVITRRSVEDRLGGDSATQLRDWAASSGRIPAPARVLDVAGDIYPHAFGTGMAAVGAVSLIGGIAAFVIMHRNAKLHPDPTTETPHP